MNEFPAESESRRTIKVSISDVKFSTDNSLLKTTLGSCVSVVLFTPHHRSAQKISSMSHFLLPEVSKLPEADKRPFRFGSLIIPYQINEMLHLGVPKSALQAKLCGGANMFARRHNIALNDIGRLNIEMARQILKAWSIPVVGESVGGNFGRAVEFDPLSGSLKVLIFGNEAFYI